MVLQDHLVFAPKSSLVCSVLSLEMIMDIIKPSIINKDRNCKNAESVKQKYVTMVKIKYRAEYTSKACCFVVGISEYPQVLQHVNMSYLHNCDDQQVTRKNGETGKLPCVVREHQHQMARFQTPQSQDFYILKTY